MLRLLGLLLVGGIAVAKPPMPASQGVAKELTPMERDHFAPDQSTSKSEYTPMLPPSRSPKHEEAAGLGTLKFDRDLMPKLSLPLGLAQLPGWVTR